MTNNQPQETKEGVDTSDPLEKLLYYSEGCRKYCHTHKKGTKCGCECHKKKKSEEDWQISKLLKKIEGIQARPVPSHQRSALLYNEIKNEFHHTEQRVAREIIEKFELAYIHTDKPKDNMVMMPMQTFRDIKRHYNINE